jgi:hypothetical protein
MLLNVLLMWVKQLYCQYTTERFPVAELRHTASCRSRAAWPGAAGNSKLTRRRNGVPQILNCAYISYLELVLLRIADWYWGYEGAAGATMRLGLSGPLSRDRSPGS